MPKISEEKAKHHENRPELAGACFRSFELPEQVLAAKLRSLKDWAFSENSAGIPQPLLRG